MKTFDSLGLHLAEFQGNIFKKSLDRYSCSSLVFLRRFKISDYSFKMDKADNNFLLDYEYAFDEIDKQFPESSYGKEKYSENVMFWMGYFYRYMCYTREIITRKAFKIIPPKELSSYYYVYHTQSEEWVISRILELKGLDESYLDKNQNLKRILKEKYLKELEKNNQ